MLRFALSIFLAIPAGAQIIPGLAIPPSGNNQKASVTQFIGPVQIAIDYSSPAVHAPDGKDRRGQIWGKLVPYGLTDLGFGNGKPAPGAPGPTRTPYSRCPTPSRWKAKPCPPDATACT